MQEVQARVHIANNNDPHIHTMTYFVIAAMALNKHTVLSGSQVESLVRKAWLSLGVSSVFLRLGSGTAFYGSCLEDKSGCLMLFADVRRHLWQCLL